MLKTEVDDQGEHGGVLVDEGQEEEEEKESGGRERGMGMIMGRFWRRV